MPQYQKLGHDYFLSHPFQFIIHYHQIMVKVKGKDIFVTGHGSPQGCERLRLPHYLYKRLIDGGKVVSVRAGRTLPPGFFFIF
jgi:hypothetical protein